MNWSEAGLAALIPFEIGLALATAILLWASPRRHTLLGLLNGAALTLTIVIIVITAGGVLEAATERAPTYALGAALWLLTLYLQVWLYRSHARSSFRNAVWDAETRRWRPGRPFMMQLVTIAVPITDGQLGLFAGEWSVPAGGATLRIDDPDAPDTQLRTVGRIDEVWLGKVAPILYGAGVIAEGADMAGRLPEIAVRPMSAKAKPDPGAPPAMFPASQVTDVLMRYTPAFEGSWLRYSERRMP